jgi:DNA-binding NarL/FixJ family response regulator
MLNLNEISKMEKIRIGIVDDHSLFRNGLKLLLSAFTEIEVISEFSNGQEFIKSLANIVPDVVLMDIEMPVMNGIEATKESIARFPELKIITLSMFGEEEYYYKMIDAGVKGFILKNSDIDEVVKAIHSVRNGGTYFSQEILYNVVKNIRDVSKTDQIHLQLSQREIEILELICKGLSNQEIGEELNISKRTVDKHRANILSKTDTKNTASLVMFAIENKLVEI